MTFKAKEVFAISRSTKLFLKSVLYTAVIMAVLGAFLLFTKMPGFKAPVKSSSESSGVLPFSPTDEDRFSLLCTLSKEKKSSPYAYFMLGFNGKEKQVSVCRLFKETVLSGTGKPKILLNESFDRGGAKGAAQALNDYFSTGISRYINFTNDSLLSFFDLFDPVVMDVPQSLSQIDRKNDIYIKIDKGRQSMSGILLLDFIACTVWEKGNAQTLYQSADAITEFLRQNHEALSLTLSSEAENYLLSSCDTNISVTDIENRRALISYLLFESGEGIVTLSLDGEFKNEETEFHLDQKSFDLIKGHYTK